jgi:hypothetical protein
MNVFRTFNIPASKVALAQKVADVLANGHQGMFRSPFDAGTPGNAGYISTGIIDDSSPMVQGRAAMKAALADGDVTDEEIDEFADLLDLTDAAPRARIAELKTEVGSTVSAADWAQPTGAQDAYPKGAVAKHNGKTWKSLQAANVFEPGLASWREVWGTATDTPPDWVQPSGSTDYYAQGARVTHNGSTWVSTTPVNVWEPGVFGWTEEAGGAPTAEPWSLGGGTGTAGSYNLNDEVTHPNAQDSGNVWLFRSKIPANTTEPGTDGTFHRWWEPVEPV